MAQKIYFLALYPTKASRKPVSVLLNRSSQSQGLGKNLETPLDVLFYLRCSRNCSQVFCEKNVLKNVVKITENVCLTILSKKKAPALLFFC